METELWIPRRKSQTSLCILKTEYRKHKRKESNSSWIYTYENPICSDGEDAAADCRKTCCWYEIEQKCHSYSIGQRLHDRTSIWDLRGGGTGWGGVAVKGSAEWVRSGPGLIKICTWNAQTAFGEGKLTSSPLLWDERQKQQREAEG